MSKIKEFHTADPDRRLIKFKRECTDVEGKFVVGDQARLNVTRAHYYVCKEVAVYVTEEAPATKKTTKTEASSS
jgi:hypothetical protein